MSYIYLLELIVDELSVFPKQSQVNDEREPPARGELCVRLQLGAGELARCEVCEKDFGSSLGLEAGKTGENCLFAYNPAWEVGGEEEPMFRISALEKGTDGPGKKLIGCWEESGRKFVDDLARAYEELNEPPQSTAEASRESLRSCNSERRCTPARSKPVSQTWKTMHPLQACGTESIETVGFVVVTIRMTCLGTNVNQKVLFGARETRLEQPVTCYKLDQDPAGVKCFATDELLANDEGPVVPYGSLASVKEPLPEEESPYDEYAAELNGNAICIRVEKDANISVNIDGEREEAPCSKGCWTSLTLPDGVYGLKEEFIQRQANACKLPVVRGTLKYPAYHWTGDFMVAKKTTPVTIEDFRKRPDPTRTVGFQACPGTEEQLEKELAGIEIYRKGSHDPNVDVFAFKLGKPTQALPGGRPNPRHWMEIELRTPRGPTWEPRPKETRGVQVLEDEFEPMAPAGRSGPSINPANKTGGADGEVAGKKKPAAGGKKGGAAKKKK